MTVGSFGKLLTLIVVFGVTFEREIELGPCYLSILEPCANNSIQFFLFYINTTDNSQQQVILDNIEPTLPFDQDEIASRNFKLVIHGYGGHVDVSGFKLIRDGKKKRLILSHSRPKWRSSSLSLTAQKTCIYLLTL